MAAQSKKTMRLFNKIPVWLLIICSILVIVNAAIIYNISSRQYSDVELTDSVTARFYANGELQLMGSGATPDYSPQDISPIRGFADIATKLTIDNGITTIGSYLFYDFSALGGELVIPASVVYIGEGAFSGSSYESAPKFSYITNNFVSYSIYSFDKDVDVPSIEEAQYDTTNTSSAYSFEDDVSEIASTEFSSFTDSPDLAESNGLQETDSVFGQLTIAQNSFYTMPIKVGGFAYNADIMRILAEADTEPSSAEQAAAAEDNEPPSEDREDAHNQEEAQPEEFQEEVQEEEPEQETVAETEADTRDEPTQSETESDDRAETEPTQSETESGSQAETEPTKSEAESGNQAETEPTKSEAESGNQAETEPTKSEAESGNQAETEPTKSEAESGNQAETEPTKSEAESGNQAETEPTQSETESGSQAETEQTQSEAESSSQAETEPTKLEAESGSQAETEPTKSEAESGSQAETEPTQSEAESGSQAETEPTKSEAESGNQAETEPTTAGANGGGGRDEAESTASSSDTTSTEPEETGTSSNEISEDTESTEEIKPSEADAEPAAILSYEQVLGSNIFFPGQVGVYKCSEKNSSFVEAVSTAGYSPYDKFAIIRDVHDIDYSESAQPYFSVWATAKNSSAISYCWQIRENDQWVDLDGQSASVLPIDITVSAVEDANYRCRIEYDGEVLYSSAAKVIFNIDKPSLVIVNNKAILSANLPHFSGFTSSAEWQWSSDGAEWNDAECSDCIYSFSLEPEFHGRFYRYSLIVAPKNSDSSAKPLLLKTSPSITLNFELSEESEFWSGNVDFSWYNRFDNTFVINSPEQLAGLAMLVNGTADEFSADSFRGKTVKLASDINLNSNSEYYESWEAYASPNSWQPIGISANTPFCGVFDGGEHSINGMYISSDTENAGLFGYANGAVIKRISVKNSLISAKPDITENASAIAAVCDGTSVKGCSVENISAIGTLKYIGGIAGVIKNQSEIIDCNVSGKVNATAEAVGGTVGFCEENGGAVVNCQSNGSVNTNGYCGGIIGYAERGCELNLLINRANVSSVGISGGICAYSESAVTNSFSSGNISSSENHAAGIVGTSSSDVINCGAAGSISGMLYAGGIVGSVSGGNIENCFFDIDLSPLCNGIVAYAENSKIQFCYSSSDISTADNDNSIVNCAVFDRDSLVLTAVGRQDNAQYCDTDSTLLTDALNQYAYSSENSAIWQAAMSESGAEYKISPRGTYISAEKTMSGFTASGRALKLSPHGHFTVCFRYENLLNHAEFIDFSETIPQGTSVILASDGSYYSLVTDSETDRLNLTDFVQMDSDTHYSLLNPQSFGNMEQLCVYFDFSDTDGLYESGSVQLSGNDLPANGALFEISDRVFDFSDISATEDGLISGKYSTGETSANDLFTGMSAVLEVSVETDGTPYKFLAACGDITYKPNNFIVRIPLELSEELRDFQFQILPVLGEQLPGGIEYSVNINLMMQEGSNTSSGTVVSDCSVQFTTPAEEQYTLLVSAPSSIIMMPDNNLDARIRFGVTVSKDGGSYSASAHKWNIEAGQFEPGVQWDFDGDILVIPAGSAGTYKIVFTYSIDGKTVSAEQTIIAKRP